MTKPGKAIHPHAKMTCVFCGEQKRLMWPKYKHDKNREKGFGSVTNEVCSIRCAALWALSVKEAVGIPTGGISDFAWEILNRLGRNNLVAWGEREEQKLKNGSSENCNNN